MIGDVHAGDITATRLATVATDMGAMQYVPAARVQIGDATHLGTTTQDTTFKSWWHGLPTPAPRYLVCGNHDIYPVAYGGSGRSVASWCSAYGLASQNYVVDLTFVRLIIVGMSSHPTPGVGTQEFELDSTARTFIDSALTAAGSQDCWIMCHAPLYGTVGGNIATDWISTEEDLFAYPDSDIRTVLAAHSNAKAWISGHTHSRLDAPDLLKVETVGSHDMAMINVSAIYATGRTVDAGDGIATAFITKVTGGIEVRFRDHVNGTWATIGGNTVTTLAV